MFAGSFISFLIFLYCPENDSDSSFLASVSTGLPNVVSRHNAYCPKFYILLTVHQVMILDKWTTWLTILFCVFIFIFNSLHVSSTSCSSSGDTNCVNTASGSCHSVSVAVSCADRKFTSDLQTTRPPTQSDSYQRLYWHNLSLLMMSTMCSKHVEN